MINLYLPFHKSTKMPRDEHNNEQIAIKMTDAWMWRVPRRRQLRSLWGKLQRPCQCLARLNCRSWSGFFFLVCLFVCFYICLFVCLSVYFVFLFVCLFACLFVCCWDLASETELQVVIMIKTLLAGWKVSRMPRTDCMKLARDIQLCLYWLEILPNFKSVVKFPQCRPVSPWSLGRKGEDAGRRQE